MMVERHYDDEALITLIESDRAGGDDHLLHCTSCTEKLDTFRLITEAFHEEEVWSTTPYQSPVPETIATLRGFADRMAAEDAAAASILPDLLAGPREEWMPRLMSHPEWRTAGVVRGLVTENQRVNETNPPDALEITMLASEVADHLQPTVYGAETVQKLRGAAWRERAFALFFTGDFAAADRAIVQATEAFANCSVSAYDQARVHVVRARVFRAFERLNEAGASAKLAADTFAQFGDIRRTVTAQLAEVALLISRSSYSQAVEILGELELRVRYSSDADMHAYVLANLGYATWKGGQRSAAIGHFETAGEIFNALHFSTEAARVRWNVAAILAEEGRMLEAKHRLRAVIGEFEEMTMTSEAALASLDLADLLLIDSDFQAVEEICYAAMRSFERAGVAYTTRAVTALSYIRECAQRRVADRVVVQHVRDYIRRLPAEPALLFAELPS